MAAGRQKKRSSASSLLSFNLLEPYREKRKKNAVSYQIFLNTRSHISLEWDDYQKKAVAKKEQIGITLRDMAPFIGSVALHSCKGLADVISIPKEVFKLKNLTDVLSYEVWKTNLSESERSFLCQFLPNEVDVDQAVQQLLRGENLHFGNYFLEWSDLLCSGDLHPDAVIQRDMCFKANKKAYYSELQKYHNDLISTLQQWKDKWASLDDREKDVVQIWRKELKFQKNKTSSCAFGGKTDFSKTSTINRICANSSNEANYMSYFKISKKQHQLVKRIKQSSDGIPSKSLNHVLGDVKSFCVRPYHAFEDEQKKKIHDYWIRLVRNDVPIAFANRKEKCLQRDRWNKSVEQEIVEKIKYLNLKCVESKHRERTLCDGGKCEDKNHQSTMSKIHYRCESSPGPNRYQHQTSSLDRSLEASTEHGKQELFNLGISSIVTESIENLDLRKNNDDLRPVSTLYYPNYCSPLTPKQTVLGQPSVSNDTQNDDKHTSIVTSVPSLHVDNGTPIFSPFSNHRQRELLLPAFPSDGMLQPYSEEPATNPKHLDLSFINTIDPSVEVNRFPLQISEHGPREIRAKVPFMHQIMQKNLCLDDTYRVQELLPHLPQGNWNVESINIPSYSPINRRLSNHNWISSERTDSIVWPREISNNFGGENDGDGSLLSAVSQCKNLRIPSYGIDNSEQNTPLNLGGGGISRTSIMSYPSHSFNHLNSGQESSTFNSSAPWSNLNYPTSGIQDSTKAHF